MFCQNCGAKIEENAKYCTNCGYKINNNSITLKERHITENQNKWTIEDLTNIESQDQMVLTNNIPSDDEIRKMVKEWNDTHSVFNKKSEKMVLTLFHKSINISRSKLARIEKNKLKKAENDKKEDLKMCKELRITEEEFNALTVMEKAQLRMQFKQVKNSDSIRGMAALGSIAYGFDKIK